MRGIAKFFFISGLAYGVLGMGLGLDMAIRHDHGQLPTHAHIMVIGWVSFAIFALFYFLFDEAVPARIAQAHFWLAQTSLAVLLAGLWLHYAGYTQFEPLAAVGSVGYAVSFMLFAAGAVVALREPKNV